jgi:hypothetical protein
VAATHHSPEGGEARKVSGWGVEPAPQNRREFKQPKNEDEYDEYGFNQPNIWPTNMGFKQCKTNNGFPPPESKVFGTRNESPKGSKRNIMGVYAQQNMGM